MERVRVLRGELDGIEGADARLSDLEAQIAERLRETLGHAEALHVARVAAADSLVSPPKQVRWAGLKPEGHLDRPGQSHSAGEASYNFV